MMSATTYTCFDGHQRIATGDWQTVEQAAEHALKNGAMGSVLIFNDTTGRLTDVESPPIHEADAAQSAADNDRGETSRNRGRPKLGVVAREVTLLPRHWEWLAAQTGGASVTLRKLVEEARRTQQDKNQIRSAQERAYAFISAVAGDLIHFEEASRALFANDKIRFTELISEWSTDVRDYALLLAYGAESQSK